MHRARCSAMVALPGLGCSRGPWRIVPLVPVLCFSVILCATLIPLTVPFVSPLESLISSMGQAGAAARLSAGAVPGVLVSLRGCGLVWECSMGSAFPSRFQLSRVSEPGADGEPPGAELPWARPQARRCFAENLQGFNCSICTQAAARLQGLNETGF